MKLFRTFFSLLFSLILAIPGITSEKRTEKAEKFRVTAYAVGDNFLNASGKPSAHFETVTDVILIGVSSFNEKGEIILSDRFDDILANLRLTIGSSPARLYLNLMGPQADGEYPDWESRMDAQSVKHEKAFSSGILEKNISGVLKKYEFDGVFFDYEYPLTEIHWKRFGNFLISLDKLLGDEYKIGCAVSAWNVKITKKAAGVIDMAEIMSYDVWEKDGTHSSEKQAKKDVRKMLLKGFRPEQLDLGIPFYARPVTREAYWYGYSPYADRIDGNGLYHDTDTGLTFSFNTCDTVYRKTKYALSAGLGGVMVWHYSCDLPPEDSRSLFNAIKSAKADMIAAYGN